MVEPGHAPKASVVIAVYNGERTLEACLAALQAQDLPREDYEILVVDDGSTDRTPEILRRHDVRVLRQDQQGPATARNRGAGEARGEFLLFTDADCVPRPTWVREMLRGFEDAEVAGVKGAYHNEDPRLWTRFAQMEFEERYALLRRQRDIDMVDTHAAGFRREVFEEFGGFDTTFPVANNEDTEFSYRLSAAGRHLRFAPDARVVHLGHPDSLQAYARLKFGRGYWRSLVYRAFPGKAAKDSYTPQLLKLQVVLAAVLGMAVVAGLLGLGAGFLRVTLLFWFLSVAPFVIFGLRKDPLVALLSPWFLLVRAGAIGSGVAWFLVRPHVGSPRPIRDSAPGDTPSLGRVQMLFSLGFMESRVYKVAQALRALGWQVDVLCWDRECKLPEHEVVDGITVERIRFPGGTNAGPGLGQKLRFLRFFREVRRRLKGRRFDVLHCVNLDTLVLGGFLARAHRVPLVYDAHEPNYYAYWSWTHAPLRAVLRWLEVRLSRRTGLVLVTSAFQHRKYQGFGAPRVLLLPNYAEVRLMRERVPAPAPGPGQPAPFLFARIGSIYADTGVVELVEAFRRVARDHDHVRLRLAGRIHPPYVPVMQELLTGDLEFRVDLLGGYDYDQLPGLYEGVDVALLPYRQSPWFKEISPVKFFESMSYGVPAITSDIGGIGKVVRRRRLGIVLREASVEELERFMRKLVQRPGLVRKMSERAARAMREEFNWEAAITGLGEPYEAAVRGKEP